jgi:hypothetical protein
MIGPFKMVSGDCHFSGEQVGGLQSSAYLRARAWALIAFTIPTRARFGCSVLGSFCQML